MKKRGKTFFCTLSTLLVLSIFFSLTACTTNQTQSTTGSSDSQTNNSETQPITEKKTDPDKVRILTGNWKGTDFENDSTKYLEEVTNTSIEVISTAWGEYSNKLNTLVASGDFPDIAIITSNADEQKFVENDALEPFNKHWDVYPNIKNCRTEATWESITYTDGNVYIIPNSYIIQDGSTFDSSRALLYRKDWLDQANMSVPTTLDEYWAFADYASNQDPDGNGKKDTYAITGSKGGMTWTFDHIFGAYGTQPHFWLMKDGKVVPGSVLPETKEALIFLNKMYEAGMIDPEFITDDQLRWEEKAKKGVDGASSMFAHILDPGNMDNFYTPFKTAVPTGEHIVGEVLTVQGYDSFGGRNQSPRGWFRTTVMSSSKVMDAAFRIIDEMASPEGTKRYNYGTEGSDYTETDGKIVPTANENQLKAHGVNLYHIPVVRTTTWYQADEELCQKEIVRWNNTLRYNIADLYLLPEVAKYQTILNTFCDEQFVKMIIGELSIDDNFDTFVEEYYSRGAAEIEKALNAVHQG